MRWRDAKRPARLGAVLILLAGWSASAAEITNVSHVPATLQPGGEVTIHFDLSAPSSVALRIYDGRNIEIAASPPVSLPAGRHELQWDGTDATGVAVPPEAYVYTLTAEALDGALTVWDPTDQTGGRHYRLSTARWDGEAGAVSYELAEPSRVRIRVGLKNEGPLLGTVVDWVARAAGPHTEAWDGFDAADVLNLAAHPNLALDAQAFTVSSNAVVVGPASQQIGFVKGMSRIRHREVSRPRKKQMFDYARIPITRRRDFRVALSLVGSGDATHISREVGVVPVRLAVPPEDADMVAADRYEAAFFVDGLYVFETEAAFLPLVWQWDVSELSPGTHYLTANLRGYEGAFGMTTLRVRVD